MGREHEISSSSSEMSRMGSDCLFSGSEEDGSQKDTYACHVDKEQSSKCTLRNKCVNVSEFPQLKIKLMGLGR